jgi:tetratricopeptide (TPR) repeat protein
MPTTTRNPAEFARELEAEVEDFPEDRGSILLDAAWNWQQAGDVDRAIELLNQVLTLGGEDAGCARVSLAEVHFDLCRDADRPSSPVPFDLAGELLEERGELDEALIWFSMAAARLSEDDLDSVRDEPGGCISYANSVLVNRRRVRRALGLPPDAMDDMVREPGELLELLRQGPVESVHEVRVLFWQRAEIPRAHERWPELVQHTDAAAIFAEREAANHDLAESGVARVTMVPLTADRLADFAERTGRDPRQEDTRLACLQEVVDERGSIPWPPGRNEPCWCGSTAKYKKCCGRPGSP